MENSVMLASLNRIISLNPGYDVKNALKSLIDALNEDIRADAAKKAGSLSALKAAREILKSSRKQGRMSVWYPWSDASGRQCICDGFTAARLIDPLPLEPRPDDVPKDAGFNLDRVFPSDVNALAAYRLPDKAELLARIKTEKAEKGRAYKCTVYGFTNMGPYVNAAYLLRLMAIFPDAIELYQVRDNVLQPLYIRGKRGDGVIMPVKKY